MQKIKCIHLKMQEITLRKSNHLKNLKYVAIPLP